MGTSKKISFASIQITSRCNLDCGFCFRRLNLPETDTPTIKKIIKKLKNVGVKTIIITGGEPLLRDDIVEIFHFIKKHKLQSVLQTNGLLLKGKIEQLAPFLDWVSLSLDGDNERAVAKMRGFRDHFRQIIEILHFIKEKYKIKIKVGTIVTKVNYRHIKNIGRIISGLAETWKLYQFFPRANCASEKNKKKYFISNPLFNKITGKIIKKYPNLNIAKHSIKDYNKGPCLLVDPDGKTFISKDNGDFFIGNILENAKKLITTCEDLDIFNEIEKNFNKTYVIKVKNE